MYFILALGNPGTQYDGTRHNLGYAVADALVRTVGLNAPRKSARYRGRTCEGLVDGAMVTILWPETYMNNSGQAAAALVPKDKTTQVIAVYDEVALPLGKIRISVGGTSGGHNGVKSLVEHLGTDEFVRVRLGVGASPVGISLERHVLGQFLPEEIVAVEALTTRAVTAVRTILKDGVAAAMNTYN